MKLLHSLFALVLLVPSLFASAPAVNIVRADPSLNMVPLFRDLANDSIVYLEGGTYPVTPSMLQSNLTAGNTYTGVLLANKTNVSIIGVYGRTTWDGSSAPGEVLVLSNCSNVRISGITFIGYTNWVSTVIPITGPVFAGITYMRMDTFIFENNYVWRHYDQGIMDGGSTFSQVSQVSSNGIIIRNNVFRDCGGWRSGGGAGADGTAITHAGGTIEGNFIDLCYRGIEPYTDQNSANQTFVSIIRNNTMRNCLDRGIYCASTNNVYSVIQNNYIENESSFIFHNTNYGGAVAVVNTVGIQIAGGRGYTISGNVVRGLYQTGYFLANSASKLDDVNFTDNLAQDIGNAGGQGRGFYFGDPGANSAANATSIRRALIARNRAVNCQEQGFAFWTGRDCDIIDNITRNCNLGAAAADSETSAAFVFGYSGIPLAIMTNINVRGNIAYIDNANSGYGFYLQNVGSMIFENNQAITNATSAGTVFNGGITNNSGANVTVLGPLKTFYATIDLPSIGVNSQFTTNFTATDVNTNYSVENLRIPAQFYASGNTTNIVYNAWCSNNTVYIKFSNNDAVTAADAPSVRMTATVRQTQIAGQ